MPTGVPSKKTQLFLVDQLTDWTVREIEGLFVGNGLTRSTDVQPDEWPVGTSVRRGTAASYLAAVDLSDERERVQLLRVFSDLLEGLHNEDNAERLARLLNADGVSFESPTRIAAHALVLPEERSGRLDQALPDYTLIKDPGVLRDHARRMQRASVAADPPDAILAARELLESACKLVLEDYGKAWPKNASAGELYSMAAKELGLDAGGIEGDDPGAKAARKVLSGLARVADGLGELRTRIGRGHGSTQRSRARQRHAELATGSAASLAVFVLDTWHERKQQASEGPR